MPIFKIMMIFLKILSFAILISLLRVIAAPIEMSSALTQYAAGFLVEGAVYCGMYYAINAMFEALGGQTYYQDSQVFNKSVVAIRILDRERVLIRVQHLILMMLTLIMIKTLVSTDYMIQLKTAVHQKLMSDLGLPGSK